MRIKLLPSSMEKENRIEDFNCQLDVVLNSGELQKLLKLLNIDDSCLENIEKLKQTFDKIDYRNGRESQYVKEEKHIELEEMRKEIFDICYSLGMVDGDIPASGKDHFDSILILGGSYNANYIRTRKAYEYYQPGTEVAGLSCSRPIAEVEIKQASINYSDAINEFESMADAIKSIFELNEYRDTDVDTDVVERNINTQHCIRCFSESVKVLCCPSSDFNRRANTADTMEYYLLNKEAIQKQSVLLITNNIYVPRQLIQIVPYAIKYDFDLDIAGCNKTRTTADEYNIAQYIQEIKSIINAIYDFRRTYRNYSL